MRICLTDVFTHVFHNITPTSYSRTYERQYSSITHTTELTHPFTTEDFLALGPKYLHDWKSQIDYAMPVQYFNSGWYGYGYGYGYGHYSYYGYGIKNRYQGGGVIVASQRLSRYMTGDGSKYENHLNYHESRVQFEWGATKDPKKPGPLEDANQRYGVTYLVVFFPDDNPFTADHDESEDIEVLDTYTWDGKSQKSQIKTFSPTTLIPGKTGIIALVPMEIVPDWNRDGRIDNEDRGKVTNSKPWRWWINDDGDSGDVDSGISDVPGALAGWLEFDGRDPNHADNKVNGRTDIVDFFPLYFDAQSLLRVFSDLPDVEFRFKQADNALNMVYTKIRPYEVGKFLTADEKQEYGSAHPYQGPHYQQPLREARTISIPSSGFTLPKEIVVDMQNGSSGAVFLFEANKSTKNPLVFEVVHKGKVVASHEFPLSISSVEEMYRLLNIVDAVGASPQPKSLTRYMVEGPPNFPDGEITSDKYFVFVHGCCTSQQRARGWHAETFKRLHQSGSNARFIGVTWRGDESTNYFGNQDASPKTGDYWQNVIHAFNSASALTSKLAGKKIHVIAAHSLGNILVSSAIQDHGFRPEHYFAINAAVPTEAYLSSTADWVEQEIELMSHPGWRDYPRQVWSTHFHEIFLNPGLDARRRLTWKGRFADVPRRAKLTNFYSSGEDTLNLSDGKVPNTGEVIMDGEKAWVAQEMNKGKGYEMQFISGTSGGGWAFDKIPLFRPKPTDPQILLVDNMVENPVFEKFPEKGFHKPVNDPAGSDAAESRKVRDRHLAEAIPALSHAAGRVHILDVILSDDNVDMQGKQNGWPQERLDHEQKKNRWTHGDIKAVAYLYNYELYHEFVLKGKLNEDSN